MKLNSLKNKKTATNSCYKKFEYWGIWLNLKIFFYLANLCIMKKTRTSISDFLKIKSIVEKTAYKLLLGQGKGLLFVAFISKDGGVFLLSTSKIQWLLMAVL